MARHRFEEPVENVGALGCALADSAEDKVMLDVVGVKKAETEMGLVLFGDGTAEVCVFEIHLEAVVSDTRNRNGFWTGSPSKKSSGKRESAEQKGGLGPFEGWALGCVEKG